MALQAKPLTLVHTAAQQQMSFNSESIHILETRIQQQDMQSAKYVHTNKVLQQLFGTLPSPGALAQKKKYDVQRQIQTILLRLHKVHGTLHALVNRLETLLVEIDMRSLA